MRISLLLSLFLSITIAIQAQNSLYPDVPFTKLYLVDAEGDNIYTAGSCDVILISEDGGNQWETIEVSTYGLLQIEIVPNTGGEKAFYLFRSRVYILDMLSKTLEDITDDNLNSMSDNFKKLFIKDNSLYLVDDVGVFKADIGSYQWEKHMDFTLPDEFIMRADQGENFIWLGSSVGNVIRVDLEEKTQTAVYQFPKRIYNIEMVDDSIGYFTYQSGSQIYKTTDSGASFFPLDGMPEASSPLSLGKDIFLTINTNRIYVSEDGGITSQYIASPKDGLTSLVGGFVLLPDTTLYMVGSSGMVLKSTNLGQSYEHLNPFHREDLQSIAINENGEGYAVGGTRNVVHTMDGGESWSFLDWGSDNKFYQSVVPAGNQRFLIASDAGILIAENKNFTIAKEGSCYLLYASPLNSDIYAVYYNSGLILSKSTDLGNTWTDLSPLSNNAYHLHQTANGKLYTIDADRQLTASSDDGQNWEIIPLEGYDGNVSSFFFLDDEKALISSGNALYKTLDGGNTATQIASNYGVDNMHMFSADHLIYTYATNSLTAIQESLDGGESWQSTGSFCSTSYDYHYDGDESIWYAQKGGHINKHTILKASGIFDSAHEKQVEMYPNPVLQGQDLNITLDSDKSALVTVYDMTGKIKSRHNLKGANGRISTGELVPGTYFLETILENGEKHHGKFIVSQ